MYRAQKSVFSKLSALVLAFLILLPPLAPVFAQDASATPPDSSSTAGTDNGNQETMGTTTDTKGTDLTASGTQTNSTTDTTTSTQTANSTDDSQSTTDITSANSAKIGSSTLPAPMMASALVGPTGTPLAPGNTDIAQHLIPKIDSSTGASTYTYNLKLPPGRNGFTPNLDLSYNSQNADNQSVFGNGWTESIPYITRTNRHGTDQLYTGTYPVFTSSLSGELTQLTSTSGTNPEEGTYGSKVETGDFITYTYASNVWTATDKQGNTYTFGGTSGSRQDDFATTANVYKWMLSKQADTNNNYIAYTYYKNAGQIYPDTVSYGGNGSGAGIFEVDFQHTLRSDVISSSAAAFSNTPAYVIDEIDVKVSGSWVKKYVLAYSANSNGAQGLLQSITESGKDSTGTVTTLPSETFDYNQVTSHTWNLSSTMSLPVDTAFPTLTTTSGGSVHVGLSGSMGINVIPADLNGDGLTDFVQAVRNLTGGGTYAETNNVYLNTGSGWTLSSSWSFPTDPAFSTGVTTTGGSVHVALDGNGVNAVLMDVNGDGLPDLVETSRSLTGGGTYSEISNVYLNTGSGWTLSTSWSLPADASMTGSTTTTGGAVHVYIDPVGTSGATVIPLDVNGDGLPDFVQSTRNTSGGGLIQETDNVYLNTGSGWTLSSSWSFPVDPTYSYTTTMTGGPVHVAINGNGTNVVPMDVNGDGLPDLVESFRGLTGLGTWVEQEEVFLNTGNGWALDTSWTLPLDAALTGSTTTTGGSVHVGLDGGGDTVTPIDINGDGLIDLVQATHHIGGGGTIVEINNIYINTGSGWALDTTWTLPADPSYSYTTTTTGGTVHVSMNGNGVNVTPIDVNGDGLPDFVEADRAITGGGTVNENDNIYLNSGPLALLSEITLPTGGTISATYKPTPLSGNNNLVPQKVMVVTSLTTTDPVLGTSGTDTYAYIGGEYFYNGPFDRKFAGFNLVQKTDAGGNITKTYYHTGDGTDTTHGEYADMESKIGKIYRTEQYSSSGSLYNVTVNKWDNHNIGTDHDFVKLIRSTTLTYDGGSSHRDTSTEYSYDNTNGNLTQKVNWGEVTGATDGSFSDTGTDKSTENISYATPSSGSVTGAQSDDTVLDQSGGTVRRTRTYYDTLSLGSVTLGHPTKEEKWVTSSTYVNTQKTYDATYGIVTSSTDADGNTTTYTPDTNNLYPEDVTDALGNVTSYVYDYPTGKVTQTIDPNGFEYDTTYDGLDRVLTQSIPDFTGSYSPVLKTRNTYTDTSGAVSVEQIDYLSSSSYVVTYSYFDGLARMIQKRKEAEVSGTFNVTDDAYNTLGQMAKESLPYTSSGSSRTTATSTTALYTTYAYDPIGRTASSTNAVGTTANQYSLWTTAVTDPAGEVKVYYKDAYDNLVQVDEHNGASVYSTYYTWDLNSKLTNLTDALGNVRNFRYDGLGQRLMAEDLHDPADGTFGVWDYQYDDAGNLTQSVSPNANTVNYTYDALNRELTEDLASTSYTEATYTYDTCTNGIGKLCVAFTYTAEDDYEYDSNGNVVEDSMFIGTTAFDTQYEHDRQGNVTLLTYPDTAKARYTYNGAGQMEKIERGASGTYSDVVSNFDYAPNGAVAKIEYINGVTTTNTYDSAHLYRLTNKKTVNTVPVSLQDTAYTYDADGNITGIVDSSATDGSKTLAYTYDGLNRLLSATATSVASGTSTYAQTYTYDAIGNLITRSDVGGTYQYLGSSGTNYANPHAATKIHGGTLTYDKDGNELTDSTTADAHTYVYNYKDEPTEIDYGTSGVDNPLYDYLGNRVHVYHSGVGADEYPNKYYSTHWLGTNNEDFYAGNMLVASFTAIPGHAYTAHYINTDDILGSNVATNSTGSQVQLLDYFPFGGNRLNEQAGTFDEEKQYGGHYFDESTGLSYLGARDYDPSFGRFTSEDPSFLSLSNDLLADPQILNSYSYARENPITKIDPDGKMSQEHQAGLLYMYNNNSVWRGLIDHPYAPAIIGTAPLAIYGGVEAFPYVANAVSTMAANPGVQQAAIRGTIGAGTSMSAKALGNEANGQQSSFGSYAFNGATGFVAGVLGMKTGPIGAGIIGGVINGVNQMEENGTKNVSGSSIGISAIASSLSAGTMSNIPTNAISQFGKILAEGAVGWSIETPAQIINTGLRR